MKKYTFIVLILVGLLSNSCKTQSISSSINSVEANRYFENSITHFGAIPDDNKDDTEAIIEALQSTKRSINFPSGTYLISKPITLPNDIIIIGSSNTILKASKKIDNIFNLRGNYAIQNLHIENIIFDGNKLAKNCILFYKSSFNSPSTLENCRFNAARESGAVFKACQTSSYYNIRATKNGKHGFEFHGCNAMRIFSLSSTHNKESGVYVSRFKEKIKNRDINFSGGIEIFSIHSEHNDGHGSEFNDVQTMTSIYGGWIEGNIKDGVKIQSSSVHLNGIRMSARHPETSKDYFSVHVYKSIRPSDVVVNNCFINNGKNNWHDIIDQNSSNSVRVSSLHRFNGQLVSKTQQEKLGQELIDNTSWTAWYKSKMAQTNKDNHENIKAVEITPVISKGGAYLKTNSVSDQVLKITFLIKGDPNSSIQLQINPESSEPSSSGTYYQTIFKTTGDWQEKSFYYLSKSIRNNIWIRTNEKELRKFKLGDKVSLKPVYEYEKLALDFLGNMKPLYKELTPEILSK